LETGIWGAGRNVHINAADIEDAEFRESALAEAKQLMERAREKCGAML
jgi:glutamate formiminotransferase/formiminotetrahydrofolate cyclodeaminase